MIKEEENYATEFYYLSLFWRLIDHTRKRSKVEPSDDIYFFQNRVLLTD